MGEFIEDVVVVGGGLGGLVCAGTLISRGIRPILLVESKEVGFNLRSVTVDGLPGFMQHPTWQHTWDLGGWYPVLRELNVETTIHPELPYGFVVQGTGDVHQIPICASASALFGFLDRFAPFPMDEVRQELEPALQAGMDYPWRDLCGMTKTSLADWLKAHGVGPVGSLILATLLANLVMTNPETALQELSVFGAFSLLRSLVCGEGTQVTFEPDIRKGLCVPIADAIEKAGGIIRRDVRVDSLNRDDSGRTVGVRLRDGEIVNGSAVALAVGNPRIDRLFGQDSPAVIRDALDYARTLTVRDLNLVCVSNEQLGDVVSAGPVFIASPTGENLLVITPQHSVAPWTTNGRYMYNLQSCFSVSRAEELGDDKAIYDQMLEWAEEFVPGIRTKVTHTSEYLSHTHHWFTNLWRGPMLPRTMEELPGLWFVGDGSFPQAGFGVESGATAARYGAFDILAALTGNEDFSELAHP